MARHDFTEVNLYFYMHRINDFELIDFVKSQKQSRKLNSLLLRLLRRHILEERERLLGALLKSEEELGFLPDVSNSGYIQKDFIDLNDVAKSFLKIESELTLLKQRLSN